MSRWSLFAVAVVAVVFIVFQYGSDGDSGAVEVQGQAAQEDEQEAPVAHTELPITPTGRVNIPAATAPGSVASDTEAQRASASAGGEYRLTVKVTLEDLEVSVPDDRPHVELRSDGDAVLAVAKRLDDSTFEVTFGVELMRGPDTPVTVAALCQGYVTEFVRLWEPGVGFLGGATERRYDVRLRRSTPCTVQLLSTDGTPIRGAEVEIGRTSDPLRLAGVALSVVGSGRTNAEGRVELMEVPIGTPLVLEVGFEGADDWARRTVRFDGGTIVTVVLDPPCVLRVDAERYLAENPPPRGRRAYATLVALREGSAGPRTSTISRTFQDSVAEFVALRRGERFELRIGNDRKEYMVIEPDLEVTSGVQEYEVPPGNYARASDDVLPLEGVLEPFQARWQLELKTGAPFTLQDLGGRSLNSVHCTWEKGEHSGRFALFHTGGAHDSAAVGGELELPIELPFRLHFRSGWLQASVEVLEWKPRVIIPIDQPEPLPSLVRVSGRGPNGRSVSLHSVELVAEETGDRFSTRRRRGGQAPSLDLQVAHGRYRLWGLSAGLRAAFATVEVAGDEVMEITLQFSDPSIVEGTVGRTRAGSEVLLTSAVGPSLTHASQWRTWSDSSGAFQFAAVPPGRVFASIVDRVRGSHSSTYVLGSPMEVASGGGLNCGQLTMGSSVTLTLEGPNGATGVLEVMSGSDRIYMGRHRAGDLLQLPAHLEFRVELRGVPSVSVHHPRGSTSPLRLTL